MTRFATMVLLVALIGAGCGRGNADSTGDIPAAIAYAADGETLFTVDCGDLSTFVLATPDLSEEQRTDQTLVLLGSTPELAAELTTFFDLSARYGSLPDDEVAMLFATFEKFDRGTHRACRVPVFSAPDFMERQVFCLVGQVIDPEAGPAVSEPEQCQDPRALSVPCFEEIPTPGRIVPFTYQPIDCAAGARLQLADDGTWYQV